MGLEVLPATWKAEGVGHLHDKYRWLCIPSPIRPGPHADLPATGTGGVHDDLFQVVPDVEMEGAIYVGMRIGPKVDSPPGENKKRTNQSREANTEVEQFIPNVRNLRQRQATKRH